MKNKIAVIAFLFALALLANVQAQDSKKLNLDLFLDWEYVINPQISPDGAQIAYTRRWTDKVNDKYENEVWIVNVDGSRNRFLLKGASPAWSPDGKRIAYTVTKKSIGNLYSQPIDGSEPKQLTNFTSSRIYSFDFSPDGKQIICARGELSGYVALLTTE